MLQAAVTLFVGFWIQRAFRAQGELDRIPIGSISRVCERTEKLINDCLEADTASEAGRQAILSKITALSNEIAWLNSIADMVGGASDDVERLSAEYFRLKAALTDTIAEQPMAVAAAHAMRTACLQIQWRLARSILGEGAAFLSAKDS